MSFTSFVHTEHRKFTGAAAVSAVAAVIGAAFAGSTLVTPLYAIYMEQFGFSQITLTLVYAAYHYFGRFLAAPDSQISFSIMHGWSAFGGPTTW